jgi:WD40 repeat protein
VQSTLNGHDDGIYALDLLFKSGDLISGSNKDGRINRWSLNSQNSYELQQSLRLSGFDLFSLAVLPNNNVAASYQIGNINDIKIWNFNENKVIRSINNKNGHTAAIVALLLLNDGTLASGSRDNTIKIWNVETGILITTLAEHSSYVNALALLGNGDLVSGSRDKSIKIWDIDTETVKMTLLGHDYFIFSLAVLPNGDLVSGSEDRTIKIWNTNTGQPKRTLTGHKSVIFSLAILDNNRIASGSADRTVKIWNLDDKPVERY